MRDGEVVMDRTLELKQMTVPPAEYTQERDFFDRVPGAESAPVVLVKQSMQRSHWQHSRCWVAPSRAILSGTGRGAKDGV